jgi:hypothetical protein
VGSRAGLDAMEERKTFCPYDESNPGSSGRKKGLYHKLKLFGTLFSPLYRGPILLRIF